MSQAVWPTLRRSCAARGSQRLERGLASLSAPCNRRPTISTAAAAAYTAACSAPVAAAHQRLYRCPANGGNSSSSRRLRLLHTVPAVQGDRVVAAQMLQHPEELFQFAESSSDLNLPTLQQVLRQLAKASKTPEVAAKLHKDPRLQQLLQQIELKLPEADGRLLAQVASALGLLRVTTHATQQLALQLGRETISRSDCLAPRSLCILAASLASLQVRGTEVQQFVWREVQQQLQQLQPPDLCLLLEAMRVWGAYSRSSCDLLLQRMSEEIDSFTAADVTSAIDAIASMGLARGFLIRQLSSLAFENLYQFSQQQLLVLMRGLGRLRFLTPANCETMLQHFKVDCSSGGQQKPQEGSSSNAWTPHKSAMLLGALALCDVGPSHQESTALLFPLLEHVETAVGHSEAAALSKTDANSADSQSHRLGFAAMVEACYALCYFQVQEKSKMLQWLLEAIYAKPVTKDRVLLMKLHEIQRAVELELRSCKVEAPLAWRTAFDEAARQVQDRQECSGLHAEVALALDLLRGGYRLQFQRNSLCGGYRVDFYDQETRICVDVDTVYRHSPCTMKHRQLELQGILPVSIQYWQWRRCRSEAAFKAVVKGWAADFFLSQEDQLLYLQQRLAPVLEKRGRLQPKHFY